MCIPIFGNPAALEVVKFQMKPPALERLVRVISLIFLIKLVNTSSGARSNQFLLKSQSDYIIEMFHTKSRH